MRSGLHTFVFTPWRRTTRIITFPISWGKAVLFFFLILGELHIYWINYADVEISTAIKDSRKFMNPEWVCSWDLNMAYVLAETTHTYSLPSGSRPHPGPNLCTDRPLCAGTDEICMHVRLDYTCRLWEPGPLQPPFTVWAPKNREHCFQCPTSNTSHSLIGSATHKIRWENAEFLGRVHGKPPHRKFTSISCRLHNWRRRAKGVNPLSDLCDEKLNPRC